VNEKPIKQNSEIPGHLCLDEPPLLFHPDRQDDIDCHPLRGLAQYGPYSRALVSMVQDPIRLAIIAPHGELGRIDGLIAELEQSARPQERRQYLVDFNGMSRVFGVRVVADDPAVRFELPKALDSELESVAQPHHHLAEILTRALDALRADRTHFDVVVLYIPLRWENCFYGTAEEDFDLHDHLKAASAVRGIPLQVIRDDKALAYPCRCSLRWRVGIALYCKAGGIPWKLARSEEGHAFIGISYASRKTKGGETRFVTCCSQVFDADGAGLDFLLYETDDFRVERENPFLSRGEMRRVMTRSLVLYTQRHSGRAPKRVTVHKSSQFTRDEVDGCFDACQSVDNLDLLHIQQDVPWRGIKIEEQRGQSKGVPASYPCERGSMVYLGDREVLLWTQGNTVSVTGGRNFFKEGKGIPSPLLINRYAGHGAFDDACNGIMGLTKMDWNNDGLYDRLPVTIGYAKTLARTVKRMTSLGKQPYQFRFFM